MGGKGQAVWAPVPAAPRVLRPRDGHSTPGPGAPALGSGSAGERRARRQRPPGSDARSLLWLRRGHRPRVPSPVRLAATLPLTGRTPPSQTLVEQPRDGVRGRLCEGRASRGHHPGRANLQLGQVTAVPAGEPWSASPSQTHVLCRSEPPPGGAALAPTSARRRGESHTRFIMTLLVAAKARNVHTARGAPARAGVGVARGRGQGWAGGCHRVPSNAFKCF